MGCSTSYALQNFVKVDRKAAPGKLGAIEEFDTDNLRLIRAFQVRSNSLSDGARR